MTKSTVPASIPEVCFLAQRLINAGYMRGPWNPACPDIAITNRGAHLPSRMLRFPMAYVPADHRRDGMPALMLRHPSLAEDPFVKEVSTAVNCEVIWAPTDHFGRDFGANYRWFHAVDLVCEGLIGDLLETRHLTEDICIGNALTFGLEYGKISAGEAREGLAGLGVQQPNDVLQSGLEAGSLRVAARGKAKMAQFRGLKGPEGAWFVVACLEAGLIRRRGDFLALTPLGIATIDQPASAADEPSMEP